MHAVLTTDKSSPRTIQNNEILYIKKFGGHHQAIVAKFVQLPYAAVEFLFHPRSIKYAVFAWNPTSRSVFIQLRDLTQLITA